MQISFEMTVILGPALSNNLTLRKAISPPPITVTGFWETLHYKMLLYSALYIQQQLKIIKYSYNYIF